MSHKDNSIYHGNQGSNLAKKYSMCRPKYPKQMFEELARLAPGREIAVDCGTGNGQAAQSLADYFTSVTGIDTAEQISQAKECSNVSYHAGEAESIPHPDQSVDLVTAAQSVHWFDLERFYLEVQRVLKPNGVLALWTYLLPTVEKEIDLAFLRLYEDQRLHKFWPNWISHVRCGYVTLPCPTGSKWTPFYSTATSNLNLSLFLELIETWAVVQLARKEGDNSAEDCIKTAKDTITELWGPASIAKQVSWKISGVTTILNSSET